MNVGFKFSPKNFNVNKGTFFTTPSPPVKDCMHASTTLKPGLGNIPPLRYCLTCAKSWEEPKGTGGNAPPSHYLKQRQTLPWEREEWGGINPQSREAAQGIIDNWNKSCEISGMQVKYKLAEEKLVCVKCGFETNSTYKDDLCCTCHINAKVLSMPPKKPKPVPLVNPKWVITHKEGDIWKLPAVNSPMWTTQWAYQGSAKNPYIISRRTDGQGGGSVTSEGWACSCPNFTQHTPRTECKHILKVMMSEGFSAPSKTAKMKMAGVDDAQLAAFKKWQKEQAEAGVSVLTAGEKKGKMNLFDKTARKFR